MTFNKHSNLEGKHAFLSGSNYHWLGYDEKKLESFFYSSMAKQRGTELHELACKCITLGVKLPRTHKTLNMYVNDGIGYRMSPEVLLYVSDNFFGTADTIAFKQNLLRIHDLKTGITPASMKQLDIYTAYFCIEYHKDPAKIDIENRIYQNDDMIVREPPADDILYIMDKILTFDQRIDKLRMEE